MAHVIASTTGKKGRGQKEQRKQEGIKKQFHAKKYIHARKNQCFDVLDEVGGQRGVFFLSGRWKLSQGRK